MTIEDRLAALETQVATLRTELERVGRGGRERSMRRTHRCPMCGGTELLHFPRVQEASFHALVDLALNTQQTPFRLRTQAPLEAYACRACHVVEWHAITFDGVEIDGEHVIEISGAEPDADDAGPYRR